MARRRRTNAEDDDAEGGMGYLIRVVVVLAFVAFALFIVMRMLDWRISVWTHPPTTAPVAPHRP